MDKNVKITDTSMIAWIMISATLVVGPIEIALAEDFQIDQYLGCFYDDETQRQCQLHNSSFSSSSLTIDICIQHCRMPHSNTSEGVGLWSYASLQNGRNCRCSNDDPGTQLQDSFCYRTCEGNASQYCGGTYGNQNPTYVLYSVCPIGTYDTECDKVCHCKGQLPCDRQTGRCPDGCHGKYTGAQCNRLTSFSEQYIGCYRDNNDDRTMEKRYYLDSKNTLQHCLDLCSSKYSYAGLQYGIECWCGESYDKHGRIDERLCDSRCPGNRDQFCGGGNALSVYGTCPIGNYGPMCAKVCNCEGRCHHKNGTCLKTGCKPGWTGDTCNIRECRDNNGGCASDEACTVVNPISSLTASVCRCKTGYWRSGIRGACTDIDECSEIPNICGSFAKSCRNSEGGYTCHCTNGKIVQNSACIPDRESSNDLAFIVGAISGSIILLLSAMLIAIVILYWRMRKRTQTDSSVASTVRSGKKSEEKLTKMNRNLDNAKNPESDESTYVGLGHRTTDDNRVYDALQMDDYANP